MSYKFTIGIIVCDKDFRYIEKLLENIHQKVIGDYNIIIYNNCDLNYDALENLKTNAIILPNTYKCKNPRQLYARKMITNKAFDLKTDYIWFIDADDEILQVDFNKLDYYTDIIIFPYNTEEHKDFMNTNLESGIIKSSPTWNTFLDVGCPLWRKFIKTEIFKKAYDLVDAYNLPPISCSEDTLASLLCLKFAKTYSKHHETLYFNHAMRGDSCNSSVHINNIKNSTIGLNEFFQLTETLFSKKEQKSLKMSEVRKTTLYWIESRICLIEDEKELQEGYILLNSLLDEKYINEYINKTPRRFGAYCLKLLRTFRKVFQCFQGHVYQ